MLPLWEPELMPEMERLLAGLNAIDAARAAVLCKQGKSQCFHLWMTCQMQHSSISLKHSLHSYSVCLLPEP